MGIPGLKQRPFWVRESFNAWVVGVPTLLASSIALAKACYDGLSWEFIVAFSTICVLMIVGLILKVFQGKYKDREHDEKSSPEDLSGCLTVIYHEVATCAKPDGGKLAKDHFRVTLHRCDGEQLEQIVQYVGATKCNGNLGRRFSCRSGIIGKAVLQKKTQVAQRADGDFESYLKELVTIYHVPEADAKLLTQDRRSFMAVPITNKENESIGVVYADSNDRDFFTEEIQDRIIAGCFGVAEYIETRYP